MLSGCTSLRYFPVETLEPDVSWDFERVHLTGLIGVPFCKARNHTFVYDTESHENWEDYQYKISCEGYSPSSRRFDEGLSTRVLEHEVTYYVRAVAYCYDFKRPFKFFKEGYYTADKETFIINW